MNTKSAIGLRIFYYVCIVLIIACAVVASCTLRTVEEGVWYRDKYNVALYIYKYHHLPNNFVTKSQASDMKNGAEKRNYNIGGDTFYNREGHIDNPNNIRLVECDIYTGQNNISSRGAERLVFFSDGSLVLYTSDHYDTFNAITMWDINGLSYGLYIGAGVVLLIQISTALFITILRRKTKLNGFTELVVSLEVTLVCVIIVALSPVLFILWIIDTVRQRILARHPELDV